VTATATYNSSNQVTWTTVNSAVNGFTYDAAGNVTSDNVNLYLYDGEGRICAVKSTPVAGFTTMTGYVYDAEGNRVAKGAIATWSCDPSVNGLVTAANVTDYILGSGGEQVTEMAQNASGNMEAQHVNVWAGGKLLATYDPNGLHFYLDDPLGSRRVQTDYAGVVEQNCASLPFGDGESCAPLPTEHLFTGKERDTESCNDYFGARYYSSAMGRWMSPDKPFADQHVANPQSWNLYSYTLNNPLRFVDQDGQIVVETRDTTYYSVSGATASEAMANANTHFSGEFGGMTNSHMDFTYQFSRTPSQNGDSSFTVKDTVTSDTITLKQTVDLPKWDGYDKASPEEQKAWDDSVGKLQSHETDHENINRAGADALDKALPGTSASATGKNLDPTAKAADNKLNKAVDAKADANAQATKQNNQHLDACTNHGTQGCK
jgi:RHS repeat-associated protein